MAIVVAAILQKTFKTNQGLKKLKTPGKKSNFQLQNPGFVMNYNVQKVDTATVFMLEGKLLNEQQTTPIREKISAELSGSQKKFIFDLKGIEFVNSACLNFLVSARNRITEQGGEVVLCNVSDQLKKLLTLTRLQSLFKIAGKTSDAISLLNQAMKR